MSCCVLTTASLLPAQVQALVMDPRQRPPASHSTAPCCAAARRKNTREKATLISARQEPHMRPSDGGQPQDLISMPVNTTEFDFQAVTRRPGKQIGVSRGKFEDAQCQEIQVPQGISDYVHLLRAAEDGQSLQRQPRGTSCSTSCSSASRK